MFFRSPYADALIVVLVLLLFFGPKRLPALGKSLGQGMREFKDSISGKSKSSDEAEHPELEAATTASAAGVPQAPAAQQPAPVPPQAAPQPTQPVPSAPQPPQQAVPPPQAVPQPPQPGTQPAQPVPSAPQPPPASEPAEPVTVSAPREQPSERGSDPRA
jgi:sec-independent protein translocase protein TatA